MRNLLVGLLACAIAFGATVPRPSPEYIINLPTGQKQSVLKQKGKVVVVAFISTTCPHCQNSSKVLSRLHAEYAAKGLEVLGVAIDDGADAAAFARKFNVSFPVGTASRESAHGYLQHSIVNTNFYVPQLVFVDRQGTIRAQYGGSDSFLMYNEEQNIRKMIESLVSESGSRSSALAKKPEKKKD